MLGAFYRNLALVGVLGWLALAYGLDWLGYLVGRSPQILDDGGWVGIVSSLIPFYVAIAMVVNGEGRRVIPPLDRPLAHAAPSLAATAVERCA